MHRYKQRKDRQRSWRMLSVKILGLGIGRNGGQVAEVVIFAAVGDGFEVFSIPAMGDADTGDLALFCHVYCLLFLYNGIVGKLVPGDSAAFFHEPNNPLCVGLRLWNLTQDLLYKFFPHPFVNHSFCVVFATEQRMCGFTNW